MGISLNMVSAVGLGIRQRVCENNKYGYLQLCLRLPILRAAPAPPPPHVGQPADTQEASSDVRGLGL
jgi:hypothetical protein